MNKEAYLKQIDSVVEKGKYKADWASLAHITFDEWITYGMVC